MFPFLALLLIGGVDSLLGQEDTVIFLVRHAEKMTAEKSEDPDDPPLTQAGKERAQQLARMLAEAKLTAIFTTDFIRTRETIAPLVSKLKIEPELYDSNRLQDLRAKIQSRGPGRYLISGHSGSTPEMVELLGGEPGGPIDDATEYDRFYIVVLPDDGEPVTIRLQYGAPSAPTKK